MKPQTPQRPTSSALSPAAILASIRANNSTPTTNLSRTRSVSNFKSSSKFESSPLNARKINQEPSFTLSKDNINEKTNPDEPSELSIEAPKPSFSEIRKGILIKRREKYSALSSTLNKSSTEENRRAAVLRLFTDPVDTSMNRDDRDIKTLQNIKGSQEVLEDLRAPPSLPGYSSGVESRKSRKVTFAFSGESPEIPERSGSSLAIRPNIMNRTMKNASINERAANAVARNRAFRLIAENVKSNVKAGSEGLTLSYENSPISKAREIRQLSRERDHMRIGINTSFNNTLTAELAVNAEAKESSILDLKQNEFVVKKISLLQLPSLMASNVTKTNTETPYMSSIDKSPGNFSIKKEEYSFSSAEIPKSRGMVSSSSAASLGTYKPSSNPYSRHVDRLRKKESSFSVLNDSKSKVNFQHSSTMSKGFKIDFEQSVIDAKEEYRRKLFTLLKKQQSPDVLAGLV